MEEKPDVRRVERKGEEDDLDCPGMGARDRQRASLHPSCGQVKPVLEW